MRRAPLLAGGVALAVLTVADVPSPVLLAPALRLRQTLSVDGACPGAGQVRVLAATSVTYCYTVTNTGRWPARDIVITDARGSLRVGALDGGQSRTVARIVAATPDAAALAMTSSVASATHEPVAGAAEAATVDAMTPASSAATTVPSDFRGVEIADASVSDGHAATSIASLAPGASFTLFGSTPAPGGAQQSP